MNPTSLAKIKIATESNQNSPTTYGYGQRTWFNCVALFQRDDDVILIS